MTLIANLMWSREHGLEWTERTTKAIILNGDLAALRWASANGCPWYDDAYLTALDSDHHDIFWWMRAQGLVPRDAIEKAARRRAWKAVKWMHDNYACRIRDAGLAESVMCSAAAAGCLEIVQWVRTDLGFAIPDEREFKALAFDCWNWKRFALWFHDIGILTDDRDGMDLAGLAALHGDVEMLQWLKDKGYSWRFPELMSDYVPWGDDVDVLQWILSNGYSVTAAFCECVVHHNHNRSNILKWLIARGELQQE